uniref:Uncharacterized protein n=1 Tax=Cacopsylla melanoneura TaxID=428564 RepID=A0A8D9E791_9HEMI
MLDLRHSGRQGGAGGAAAPPLENEKEYATKEALKKKIEEKVGKPQLLGTNFTFLYIAILRLDHSKKSTAALSKELPLYLGLDSLPHLHYYRSWYPNFYFPYPINKESNVIG